MAKRRESAELAHVGDIVKKLSSPTRWEVINISTPTEGNPTLLALRSTSSDRSREAAANEYVIVERAF